MKNYLLIIIILLKINVSAQTLDDYLQIARKNNANLKVKTADFDLLQEKVNEVGNFSNTNISLGVFALTPETRVGSQFFKAGASQNLPWFGEFDAQKEAVKAQANVKEYDIILSERELDFKVKQAYYGIYKELAITEILKENKQILNTYENMALAALSNDRATMSDVLRIRVQKNELHSKIFQNINSIDILQRNFNRLLQREVNSELNIPDSLNVLDILVQKGNIEKHPSLDKIAKLNEVYDANEKLIDLDKKPKLSIGLDYIAVDKRSDVNVAQNGKDILMPKIGLSIPVFNKKFKSEYKQIKIQKKRTEDALIEQRFSLELALETSILAFDNAVLTVVAAQKNKTEMQRAINVDLKAYETGILDYDKILRLQIQKIKYELMEIEAIKNAFIAKSKVEYLTQ